MRQLSRKQVREGMLYVLIWGLALVMLIPFLWMISSSLKDAKGVFETPVRWIPEDVRWENYRTAFETMPTLLYTRNTVLVTFLSILGYLSSGSLVAYSFARLR